jgi:23S rRNA (guanosine2251-2'-O)-methyltransferase
MNHRSNTRKQRYDKKLKNATKYPISLCAINFRVDDNFGYLVRAAACFGAERIYVIGHLPDRRAVKASSGSLIDYVELIQFSSPYEFLTSMEVGKTQIVSAELAEGAKSLSSYNFNFDRPVCLVVGNEETGVPVDILQRSEVVQIDMPGVGFCLNTAQAANILLYEAVKQYNEKR